MELVDLVQFMWEPRIIPSEMGWTIMIIIPRGNVYTQKIRLLEVFWKVIEAIIDTHIKKAVDFHDVLNGFRVGIGTGTAIMELNLVQ